ncbi:hypothetical protein AB1K09_05305 [Solibacillus silvestris]
MSNNILMITYFFNETDGVGSIRSRTLNKFLNEQEISTTVLDKRYFGEFFCKNFILWTFAVFFKILFSKEKKVYVSCGPFQHLIFIVLASGIRRKELIIDFRDPWSLNIKGGYNNTVKINQQKLKLAMKIEKISYQYCKYFIVCTKGMYEEYKDLFKSDDKLKLMTNGYDFEPVENTKDIDYSNLNVVCLGKFAEYDTEKAKKAIQEVLCLAKDKNNLKLNLIGSDRAINAALLDEFDLLDNTVFYERMEYKQALEIASQCNLGMLVLRNENIEYGTKIFDYIGLGLKIIDNFEFDSLFKNEFNSFIINTSFNSVGKKNCLKFNRVYIYKENLELFC